MTKTQTQILELFRSLSEPERREVVGRLAEQASPDDFYDHMTAAQRSELRGAIAEADGGAVITSDALKAFMAERFKLGRS